MLEIGPIVALGVQLSSLKVGVAPQKRYDPSPIRSVPALALDGDGAIGLAAGGQLLDVHNARHPAPKQRHGLNGLSIGFTSHYARMRDRFNHPLPDGGAGENILVATGRTWSEAELAGGLVIETATGQCLHLERVVVAPPCVEFTRWLMRFPDDARPDLTVTDGVRFLDHGTRGYYAAYDGEPATIAVGDRMWVRD